MKIFNSFGLLLAIFVTATFAATPAAAGTITLAATATWQSKGSLYLVGENQGLFVGGFSGIMFASDGKGALNTAQLACPGMMDIDFASDKISGGGRCIITGASGDRVFAKWNCTGIAGVGCIGKMELTAGTGRFQGVTGGGEFILRTAMGELRADLISGEVTSIGLGLALWPKLILKLP